MCPALLVTCANESRTRTSLGRVDQRGNAIKVSKILIVKTND